MSGRCLWAAASSHTMPTLCDKGLLEKFSSLQSPGSAMGASLLFLSLLETAQYCSCLCTLFNTNSPIQWSVVDFMKQNSTLMEMRNNHPDGSLAFLFLLFFIAISSLWMLLKDIFFMFTKDSILGPCFNSVRSTPTSAFCV